MKNNKERFLKVLKIEIADLIGDLTEMAQITEHRFNLHEITSYVTQENIGLLNNEILALNTIQENLESYNYTGSDNYDEFIIKLEEYIQSVITEKDLPKAVHAIIQRKFKKIRDFITLD